MTKGLPPQAVVETKVLKVVKVEPVDKDLKVDRGWKVLPVAGAIPPQALKVTKVQLVIKDLWVQRLVLAQWVQ